MSVLERLIQLRSDPRVPAGEKRDVNAELFRSLTSGLGRDDFIPAEEVATWMREVQAQGEAFTKSVQFQSWVRPGGEVGSGEHQSLLYVNELGVVGQGADPFMEKPGNASGFDFLAYMHESLDVDQACVMLRQHQVAAYTRPYDENDDTPTGYRWVRRDGEKLSARDKKETARLDRILANSGTELDPQKRKWDLRRRTFASYISALVADTMVYDSCPTETVVGRDKRLLGWHNIDPRTVRLAYEDGYLGDDSIIAVQIRPEERVGWLGYQRDDLIFEVRNPRSSIYYGDYGKAELEAFVRAATAYLNSFTFNASQQDRNSLPRGFMTLYGRFDKRALNSFRTMWNDLVRGAAKRWALPVLVSESKQEGGASYTPVDTAVSEMYLAKWMTFIISILTALRGIDPTEINMDSFTAKSSSLNGKDTAEKLQSSHDRGFIPLMIWLLNYINE